MLERDARPRRQGLESGQFGASPPPPGAGLPADGPTPALKDGALCSTGAGAPRWVRRELPGPKEWRLAADASAARSKAT